jgi:hypothetical protein
MGTARPLRASDCPAEGTGCAVGGWVSSGRVAWVVYMTPFDTAHAGCGVWGITVFDAGSRQVITEEMCSTGP